MTKRQQQWSTRIWAFMRLKGFSFNGVLVTDEEKLLLEELNRIKNKLLDNFISSNRQLGFNVSTKTKKDEINKK